MVASRLLGGDFVGGEKTVNLVIILAILVHTFSKS